MYIAKYVHPVPTNKTKLNIKCNMIYRIFVCVYIVLVAITLSKYYLCIKPFLRYIIIHAFVQYNNIKISTLYNSQFKLQFAETKFIGMTIMQPNIFRNFLIQQKHQLFVCNYLALVIVKGQ